MRKLLTMLMATALIVSTVPAIAEDQVYKHGASHSTHDKECTKECDMLLKNCALEVDSIHQRIRKLQAEINNKGADKATLEEVKALNKRLKEANETLRILSKPR